MHKSCRSASTLPHYTKLALWPIRGNGSFTDQIAKLERHVLSFWLRFLKIQHNTQKTWIFSNTAVTDSVLVLFKLLPVRTWNRDKWLRYISSENKFKIPIYGPFFPQRQKLFLTPVTQILSKPFQVMLFPFQTTRILSKEFPNAVISFNSLYTCLHPCHISSFFQSFRYYQSSTTRWNTKHALCKEKWILLLQFQISVDICTH
jgi:hypothetical protein